uniref:Uncharacterized protein n=1 Tax=Chromera velia CCMP2878 TaxID=1169474 RepID=A0A0G4F5S5_9ALVE|eukprot:Cvel_15160.t1-p1 / transcript=Cvel_15160.t1 / gene=Cvel_15160 / organism=Chromera_velia_CCMP2878 / gene_product=Pentatricopeptide repeat-containing protein, putative / transcript_product=Pentatricopeptide repeat-containing protein, putative / location=Cvel_scaffold1107:12267-25819(+) / protein_length=3735 / sequence_SO=supercontig / SO=protein_coding / is_pseudo=false
MKIESVGHEVQEILKALGNPSTSTSMLDEETAQQILRPEKALLGDVLLTFQAAQHPLLGAANRTSKENNSGATPSGYVADIYNGEYGPGMHLKKAIDKGTAEDALKAAAGNTSGKSSPSRNSPNKRPSSPLTPKGNERGGGLNPAKLKALTKISEVTRAKMHPTVANEKNPNGEGFAEVLDALNSSLPLDAQEGDTSMQAQQNNTEKDRENDGEGEGEEDNDDEQETQKQAAPPAPPPPPPPIASEPEGDIELEPWPPSPPVTVTVFQFDPRNVNFKTISVDPSSAHPAKPRRDSRDEKGRRQSISSEMESSQQVVQLDSAVREMGTQTGPAGESSPTPEGSAEEETKKEETEVDRGRAESVALAEDARPVSASVAALTELLPVDVSDLAVAKEKEVERSTEGKEEEKKEKEREREKMEEGEKEMEKEVKEEEVPSEAKEENRRPFRKSGGVSFLDDRSSFVTVAGEQGAARVTGSLADILEGNRTENPPFQPTAAKPRSSTKVSFATEGNQLVTQSLLRLTEEREAESGVGGGNTTNERDVMSESGKTADFGFSEGSPSPSHAPALGPSDLEDEGEGVLAVSADAPSAFSPLRQAAALSQQPPQTSDSARKSISAGVSVSESIATPKENRAEVSEEAQARPSSIRLLDVGTMGALRPTVSHSSEDSAHPTEDFCGAPADRRGPPPKDAPTLPHSSKADEEREETDSDWTVEEEEKEKNGRGDREDGEEEDSWDLSSKSHQVDTKVSSDTPVLHPEPRSPSLYRSSFSHRLQYRGPSRAVRGGRGGGGGHTRGHRQVSEAAERPGDQPDLFSAPAFLWLAQRSRSVEVSTFANTGTGQPSVAAMHLEQPPSVTHPYRPISQQQSRVDGGGQNLLKPREDPPPRSVRPEKTWAPPPRSNVYSIRGGRPVRGRPSFCPPQRGSTLTRKVAPSFSDTRNSLQVENHHTIPPNPLQAKRDAQSVQEGRQALLAYSYTQQKEAAEQSRQESQRLQSLEKGRRVSSASYVHSYGSDEVPVPVFPLPPDVPLGPSRIRAAEEEEDNDTMHPNLPDTHTDFREHDWDPWTQPRGPYENFPGPLNEEAPRVSSAVHPHAEQPKPFSFPFPPPSPGSIPSPPLHTQCLGSFGLPPERQKNSGASFQKGPTNAMFSVPFDKGTGREKEDSLPLSAGRPPSRTQFMARRSDSTQSNMQTPDGQGPSAVNGNGEQGIACRNHQAFSLTRAHTADGTASLPVRVSARERGAVGNDLQRKEDPYGFAQRANTVQSWSGVSRECAPGVRCATNFPLKDGDQRHFSQHPNFSHSLVQQGASLSKPSVTASNLYAEQRLPEGRFPHASAGPSSRGRAPDMNEDRRASTSTHPPHRALSTGQGIRGEAQTKQRETSKRHPLSPEENEALSSSFTSLPPASGAPTDIKEWVEASQKMLSSSLERLASQFAPPPPRKQPKEPSVYPSDLSPPRGPSGPPRRSQSRGLVGRQKETSAVHRGLSVSSPSSQYQELSQQLFLSEQEPPSVSPSLKGRGGESLGKKGKRPGGRSVERKRKEEVEGEPRRGAQRSISRNRGQKGKAHSSRPAASEVRRLSVRAAQNPQPDYSHSDFLEDPDPLGQVALSSSESFQAKRIHPNQSVGPSALFAEDLEPRDHLEYRFIGPSDIEEWGKTQTKGSESAGGRFEESVIAEGSGKKLPHKQGQGETWGRESLGFSVNDGIAESLHGGPFPFLRKSTGTGVPRRRTVIDGEVDWDGGWRELANPSFQTDLAVLPESDLEDHGTSSWVMPDGRDQMESADPAPMPFSRRIGGHDRDLHPDRASTKGSPPPPPHHRHHRSTTPYRPPLARELWSPYFQERLKNMKEVIRFGEGKKSPSMVVTFEEVAALQREMETRGFLPDAQETQLLIELLSRVSPPVNRLQYGLIEKEAFRLFSTLPDLDCLRPRVSVYNALLTILVNVEGRGGGSRWEAAAGLFSEMKRNWSVPSRHTFFLLFKVLHRRGWGEGETAELAFDLYDEMKKFRVPADTGLVNTVLELVCRAERVDKVLQEKTMCLLREVREGGVELDGRSYRSLLRILSGPRYLEETKQLKREISANGARVVSPDLVKERPKADFYVSKLQQRLRRQGSRNGGTQTRLIWPNIQRFRDCLREGGVEEGTQVTLYLLRALACVERAPSEEALSLLERLASLGVSRPPLWVWCAVLRHVSQEGDSKTCERILVEMDKRGVRVSLHACNLVLLSFERRGRVKEESKSSSVLFNHVLSTKSYAAFEDIERKRGLRKNLKSFLVMLSTLEMVGGTRSSSIALEVFSEMVERDFPLSWRASSFLRRLCEGRVEEKGRERARSIWRDAQRRGLIPPTGGQTSGEEVEKGGGDESEEISLLSPHLQPDSPPLSVNQYRLLKSKLFREGLGSKKEGIEALIRILGRAEKDPRDKAERWRWKEAMSLFERLLHECSGNSQPSSAVYVVLLDLLLAAEEVAKAVDFYSDMKLRGVGLDGRRSLALLHNALLYIKKGSSEVSAGLVEETLSLFADMRRDGLVPGRHVFESAVAFALRQGGVVRCLPVLKDMLKVGYVPCRRNGLLDEIAEGLSSQPSDIRAEGERLLEIASLKEEVRQRVLGKIGEMLRPRAPPVMWSDVEGLRAELRARNVRGDPRLCMEMIRTLGRIPDPVEWREGLQLFRELLESGCDNVPEDVFCVLLKLLAFNNQWAFAFDMFEEVKRRGVSVTVFTYNTALSALCKRKGGARWEDVKSFLGYMERRCVKFDICTHNLVLSALNRAQGGSRWKEALEWLSKMREAGVSPDLISYNTVLSALAWAEGGGQWRLALQLVEEMKANGVKPDLVSFQRLLRAMEKASQTEPASLAEVALGVFEEMLSLCPASRNRAVAFLDRLANLPELSDPLKEKADRLLEAFSSREVFSLVEQKQPISQRRRPAVEAEFDERLKNLTLHTASPVEWKEVVSLREEMEKKGADGDVKLCGLLIQLMGRVPRGTADWREGLSLYRKMLAQGCTKPARKVYLELFSLLAYAEGGSQWEVAWDLFKEMKERGIERSASVYTSLFVALSKAEGGGRVKEASDLLEEMKADGIGLCNPAVEPFLSVLENAPGDQMDISMRCEFALKTVEEMRREGKHLSPKGFAALIGVLSLKEDDRRSAVLRRVYTEMRNRGIPRDSGTYAALIRGSLRRDGGLEGLREALRLLKELSRKEMSLNPSTVTLLLTETAERGQRAEREVAVRLWKKERHSRGGLGEYCAPLLKIFRQHSYVQFESLRAALDDAASAGVKFSRSMYADAIAAAGRGRGQSRKESRRLRWQTAESLFAQMEAEGITPDEETFAVMIDAFWGGRQAGKAFRMFEAMRARGIQPSAQTVSSLVMVFSQVTRDTLVSLSWQTCVQLVKDLRGGWLSLDPFVITRLFKLAAMSKSGHEAETAVQLLDQFVEEGYEPSRRTYLYLLQTLKTFAEKNCVSRGGEGVTGNESRNESMNSWICETAQRLSRGMQAQGVDLHESASSVLDVLGSAQVCAPRDFLLFLLRAVQSCPDKFSLSVHNHLLSVLSRAREGGMWREAIGHLIVMRQAGVEPDSHTFHAVLKACARAEGGSQWQTALRLSDEIEEPSMRTEVLLLEALSRARLEEVGGMWERGLERFFGWIYDLSTGEKESSSAADIGEGVLYVFRLLKKAGRFSEWEKALDVFERLKETEGTVQPGVDSLSTLIHVLDRAGTVSGWERSLNVFEEMEAKGMAADEETQEALARALKKATE